MSKERLLVLPVLLAASLAGLLAVLLTAALPVTAQSLPDASDIPAAPGSIAGTVTAEGGAPLAGMEVDVYLLSYGSWSYIRTLATDVHGAYQATVLQAGTYRIGFRDPSGFYGRAYYADALTLENATEVAVAGFDVTGIDAVLRPAGAVTGIYSNTRTSFSAVIAALVPDGSGGWQRAVSVPVTTTGPYTLSGLQPGVYSICADVSYVDFPFPSLPGPRICYDDIISSIDYAQPVTVTGGVTTTGVDLTAGVEGDGAVIGGIVRTTDGMPLPEIQVRLFGSGSGGVTTTTDASGSYELRGVIPGSYVVAFSDAAGVYIAQYYSGSLTPGQATQVVVAREEERRDVDATLARGGALSGAVRILGVKPSYATVTAEWLDNDASSIVFSSQFDTDTGTYLSTGLPPGRYRILVDAWLDGVFFGGYYGESTAGIGAVVTVTAGATISGLDVNLGAAGYDGEIAGTVTANGQPRPGIKVTLYGTIDHERIVSVLTDGQGHYTIGGLTNGFYFVGFSDPAEVYVAEYYSNVYSLLAAKAVGPVEQKQTVDVELELAGSVTGRVASDNGAPAANQRISLWYVTKYDDGSVGPITIFRQVTTDDDGMYRAGGLRPGSYRVCAGEASNASSMPSGCYGGPLRVYDPTQAQNVSVRAGVVTNGIDIYVGADLPERAYLPAVKRE